MNTLMDDLDGLEVEDAVLASQPSSLSHSGSCVYVHVDIIYPIF